MTFFYRLAVFLTMNFVVLYVSSVFAQTPPQSKLELDQGVCAFKAKEYVDAQHHFERALELKPADKRLPIYIARSIFFQYHQSLQGAAKLEKGKEVIAAYEKALAANPGDHEASGTIADLYAEIVPERLPEIAGDETLPKAVRTRIYTILAARSSTCVLDITEQNRELKHLKDGTSEYRYTKPRDPADLTKAQNCARAGIKFVEKSLELGPGEESTWSYKATLSFQMAHLAEMEQNMVEEAIYKKRAEGAQAVYRKINAEVRDKQNKADEEDLRKWKNGPENAQKQVTALANFIATGKLVKEPVDSAESVVTSPVELLVAPGDYSGGMEEKRRPEPNESAKVPWKIFTSPGGEFKALLPSLVDSSGPLVSARDENIHYQIASIKRPPGGPPIDERAVLATGAWSMVDIACNFIVMANKRCEVALEGDINVGGHLGRRYRIKESRCGDIFPGIIDAVSTVDRIYVIEITGADENDPRVRAFLKSFVLTK